MRRTIFLGQPNRVWQMASISAALSMIAATFFLNGGDDLYRYYVPFENGCLVCGYVPYFAQWLLLPIHFLLSYPFSWPEWTIVSLAGFLFLAFYTDINPLLFLISFPVLGQIWLGQIDAVICTGIALFLFSKNPFVRGFGVALAMTKPQLTGLAFSLSLLLESRSDIWKILTIPAVIFLASLAFFGVLWPLEWVANALNHLPVHVWRLASMDFWKFGLALLPVPLLFTDRQERMKAGLLVSALSTPFFGVYSYLVFLFMDIKPWHVLLSFAWCLAFPWLGRDAMRLAWILPACILASMLRQLYNREKAGMRTLPLDKK